MKLIQNYPHETLNHHDFVVKHFKIKKFHNQFYSKIKVVSHMMPDLPNVDFERDVEQFIEFFENPAFRADGLKIYPTLVIRGTDQSIGGIS